MSEETISEPLQEIPRQYTRNEDGLLQSIDYQYNADGSINWRGLVDSKFLYPNRDWFLKREKDVPKSVEGLADNQLLIMLGGIKELAKIRGYTSVGFTLVRNDDHYVSAKCKINWIPNFETDLYPVSYEEVANATSSNTDDFGGKFLETIACNRAFVRCVRNFLNIHIVGADEIDKSQNSDNSSAGDCTAPNDLSFLKPSGLLQKTCAEAGINNLEELKVLMRTLWKEEVYKNDDAANWNSFDKIPAKECRILSKIIKDRSLVKS